MRIRTLALAFSLALAVAGCRQADDTGVAVQTTEIAWREGDVADALAEAQEAGKPVILYWGAEWCPPCNQMKANLFKDPAFIAETANFVPVYLDGDTQGAQQWGERFGISGYPTVIILQPDGTEITRIASATMANELPELLRVAGSRTTSIEALLAKAADDTASLTADDWRILAGFDWRNDPKHFADLAKAGTLLDRLAANAPDRALERRFALLGLVVAAETDADGNPVLTAAQQQRLTQVLDPILASEGEVMANRQELTYDAAALVSALPAGAERRALAEALVQAGDAIFANAALSMTERLEATNIDIVLAKQAGDIPPALLTKVRARAAWADREATDKVMRQAVIDDAAYLLHDAGDTAAARKLLTAELERSDQPYYYMSGLSDFAESEGDKAGAIEWARKAYEASQGPATRVQWAILYSNTVLRNAPDDGDAVAEAAGAVLDELGQSPDGYYQRTRVKVADWGERLRGWAEGNGGADVLARLRTRMADVCAEQGAQAATCREWSRA